MDVFDVIPQNSENENLIVKAEQTTPEVIPKVNYNKTQRQESVQENKQDLDQSQEVDVKPSQINVQRLEVMINNKIENYAGKITGVVYKNKDHDMVSKAEIAVFFGSNTEYPVYKTSSDENGNFSITDLPPGYYTLEIRYQKNYGEKIINIKVLPGETSYQTVVLGERSRNKDDKYFSW